MNRAACALLLAAGCATSTYGKVLDHWTREGRVLHEVDTALEVGATYKSWDFRAAYVERSAALFKLPDARRRELAARERAAWQGAHEFFVAAATHKEQWNDLDKKKSTWRVALLCDDRQEAEPIRIERYKKIDATVEELFPYTNTFSIAYKIEFPRKMSDGTAICGPGTEHMVLRFAGPLGTLEMKWDLRAGS